MSRYPRLCSRRSAFTLVELLVVIAIIIALAALAAAFTPRVDDSRKMTRAVDNLQQWLLTAKMRAKRDGLATGLRFVQVQGDAPLTYSQMQYVQQPEPMSGGYLVSSKYLGALPAPSPPFPPGQFLTGGYIVSAGNGIVTFGNVDFTLGGLPTPNQWLVQPGDYIEINDGGVYQVTAATANTVTLLGAGIPGTYGNNLAIAAPVFNYRILRQPRILIGEEPLTLPDNYAVSWNPIPGITPPTPGSNVSLNMAGTNPELVFSPAGQIVGPSASVSILTLSVWDQVAQATNPDPARVGLIGIQARSGFIGAYDVNLGPDPFYFVKQARQSGM